MEDDGIYSITRYQNVILEREVTTLDITELGYNPYEHLASTDGEIKTEPPLRECPYATFSIRADNDCTCEPESDSSDEQIPPQSSPYHLDALETTHLQYPAIPNEYELEQAQQSAVETNNNHPPQTTPEFNADFNKALCCNCGSKLQAACIYDMNNTAKRSTWV